MEKYVSIDIETTGLDPDKHRILEFGAVIDDGGTIDKCPVFHFIVNHDVICGDPFALSMNSKLLLEMSNNPHVSKDIKHLAPLFRSWLFQNGLYKDIVVAGKNYANFDLRFLERVPDWDSIDFDYRIIDIGNIYWVPCIDNIHLPSLKKCLERGELSDTVSHRAVDDAKNVIELIRAKC